MRDSRTINGETGFYIRINLYIIRYFWNHLRNKAVWGDSDLYSIFNISRQRYGRIIGGFNFFLPPETVKHICGKLGIDEKYLTVSEDTKILPDDKIIHIDGLTFEDWETAFYCLITMEADQKRKKEEREKLEEPTDKEKKALNAIKGALSNHIAYGFISDKYGKRAPLFRIYYYFSKGVTYKEGDYAEHLINELNSLNVREWRQTDTDTLKKYQKAFSEHLEYINALLVMRKYGG